MVIPIARPWLGDDEIEAVRAPLTTGWVTQGPAVVAFEKAFADLVGARHACAVSSCTAALHLALLAVGVGPGDEVVTVSHSFIATANAVRHAGAIPIFVDIDPTTYNIDPERVSAAIGDKTRAILCVHQMGMPCDLPRLLQIAEDHELPLVEDAACAIGSEIEIGGAWQAIGRPHGRVACFSFHPRKILTTGDGGMLTTNDAQLDERFRRLRHQGMSVGDRARHDAESIVFESFTELGFNYRMTDIQASIGLCQLERLEFILRRRRKQVELYGELLEQVPGIEPPREPPWARSNYQTYCLRLPDGIDQRWVMSEMRKAGIATGRGIMNAHQEPIYEREPWSCEPGQRSCTCGPSKCDRLSNSETARDRCLQLPLFHELKVAEQKHVVAVLARTVEAASSS